MITRHNAPQFEDLSLTPWKNNKGSVRDSYYMVSHGKLQKFKHSSTDVNKIRPSHKFEDKPKTLPSKLPLRGEGAHLYKINNQQKESNLMAEALMNLNNTEINPSSRRNYPQ